MNVRRLLLDVYRRERARPFAWGPADCLAFAADCAMALGLPDPIAHLRGRYDSEIGARRVMVENGWRDLADVAASLWPAIPVAQARSGDWTCVINPDGTETIGVVVGSMIVARSRAGLGLAPLTAARSAYRVE